MKSGLCIIALAWPLGEFGWGLEVALLGAVVCASAILRRMK